MKPTKLFVILCFCLISNHSFGQESTGKYYQNVKEKEKFIEPQKAPKDAPNIVLILLDDVGFGQPSVNGGIINTPNLEKLAKEGLYYNRFHTAGICSPSRAALLTGRNSHQSGSGMIMEFSSGFPGYNSMWGQNVASIAEILKANGYNTAAFGKWHNTPDWETSAVGPFDRWPTGKGFENFYGFQGGETSQFEPQLFRNITPVEAPKLPEQGYHLTEDLVDNTIDYIQQQKAISPSKPFFAYLATGAVHAPHHAPKEWIDKYKGKFDMGWDKMREIIFERQKAMGIIPLDTKLTPRPAILPAWETVSDSAKRLYIRQMEVFAGFLEHTDYQIGRLLTSIENSPYADNTMIIYIVGDNGASAEGGMNGSTSTISTQTGFPDSVAEMFPKIDELGSEKHENHFAVPWSWAGSSPFQWMKRVPSHLGATRNSVVIKYPRGIKAKGETRTQFHHLIDIVPTICEVSHIPFPKSFNGVEQIPLAGNSMVYSFENKDLPSTHETQYFEVEGNRAIYYKGYIASAFHVIPWQFLNRNNNFDNDKWELYNLDKDFSQANNLAEKEPQKLQELIHIFDQEATKNQVYPLDSRWIERVSNPAMPSVRRRKSFTYNAATTRLPEGSSPSIYMKSHSITAKIKIENLQTEGVIVACGGSSGGYSLFVKNGKLYYDYNFYNKKRFSVSTPQTLPMGDIEVKMVYQQIGKKWGEGGKASLYVNGILASEGEISNVSPGRFSATETFDVGIDLGAVVSHTYEKQRPFKFTGKINEIKIEIE